MKIEKSVLVQFCFFVLVPEVLISFSLLNAFPVGISKLTLKTTMNSVKSDSESDTPWIPFDKIQEKEAKEKLEVWPLDEENAALLNEVHPRGYIQSTESPYDIYDLIAVGAGAGGLVSSKQVARRGGKSALISEKLAGGDCLNVGCVPSKALIRAAKSLREVKRASSFGIDVTNVELNFSNIMKRLRQKRRQISPADGHEGTTQTGCHVFQGRGRFTSSKTIEVNGVTLEFKNAVIATGGRPKIPMNIPGLKDAPFTTNEQIFNLDDKLPPRMVILGSGIIALEMAQCFATFGSDVTVLNRSSRLFESRGGDEEAATLLQSVLEKDGVKFLSNTELAQVETIHVDGASVSGFPLMKLTVISKAEKGDEQESELECECLLVATGRTANVEDLGLDIAGVDYEKGKGIIVNDSSQSVSNPHVWGVGDVVSGVPRQTHQSGEMARVVVQNALFDDEWKLSSLVTPAVMFTEPEYAIVGIASAEQAAKKNIDVDIYRGGLEHNDRAILESENPKGFCKIICEKGTERILGATIVSDRAGEMINEVTLAMKHNIPISGIGRNIHAYPTMGEAVMGAGLQYIGTTLPTL